MKPWRYFIIVFVYSWIIWSIAIFIDTPIDDFPTGILFLLGGLGPTVGWIICNTLDGKKGPLQTILKAVRFDSLGLKGLAVTTCLGVLPMFLSWLVVSEGSTLEFTVVSSIVSIIFFIVVSVVEEIGWRGCAYPQLNQIYSPITSSLIVGILWSLWHLPLTMIKGTYQHGLVYWTLEFFLFFFSPIPNSMIFGWLLKYTNQNLASSVLFHTLINLTGEVFGFRGKSDIVRTVVITLLAILLGIKMV
ncbi:CAAX amino terminal protease family [Thaumarchaeota archaeon SCGC AB-539-E09]|nr:CAAX amino terminal protease family [Thaumarchaeota archaeon SCGC AB-539-E09]